ncbi:MAG: tetrahydromethanopterin S-methyltransferase subunit H [Nitrososphaerota archaeon]|nr:tetrahydromethanopterin S-methyltransferase subunit H [Nitrososphaerota archaeon]
MEQKVYDIGGFRVGGEAYENPSLMIGSIFYRGDKIVEDEKTGEFSREEAETRIRMVEELVDRTGLAAMIDIVCSNPEAAHRYVEFVADTTNLPVSIDAVSEEAAVSGIKAAQDLGILERTVFNSISPETKETVYAKIREAGLKSAIILTYSARAIISSAERVKILETLIPKVKAAGIEKILVDTVVVDVATLGLACKAIREVKERFGYPSGCGAHNAISSWKSLREKMDKNLKNALSAVVNTLPLAVGADFILYGPIDAADHIFPAASLINATYGQILLEEGKKLDPKHPRFKISRF